MQQRSIGGSEPVPTLAELFDAFPDARFNIDLKSEGAVEALADFIEEREAWDRVLVGSFSARRLRRVPAAHGGPGRDVGAPARGRGLRPLPQRPAGAAADPRSAASPCRSRTAGAALVVATRRLVRRAHAAGLQVHVWTIDDPIEMNTLLDRGVDGIMTDRTDILRDVLRARGQWRRTRR